MKQESRGNAFQCWSASGRSIPLLCTSLRIAFRSQCPQKPMRDWSNLSEREISTASIP